MSAALQPRDERTPTPPTLAELDQLPRWVGWRTEAGTGGRITKVPKIAFGERRGKSAKSTDPETWTTRERAEAWHRSTSGDGGVGVVLGEVSPLGYVLCGIDLDTCRDKATGTLQPWALSVIGRFNAYAEVSPSGTGVKVFFLIAPADLDGLRRLLQEPGGAASKLSRTWKWAGNDHPPAIEFYRGDRYFAVTGERFGDAGGDLRVVSLDDVRGLFEVDGPALLRLDPAAASGGSKPTGKRGVESGSRDNSRSAKAHRLGFQLVRDGATFEAMCEAIASDPETASWYREKGTANGNRELRNTWEKATAAVRDEDARVDEIITRFNGRYALVNDGGRAIVFEEVFDHALKRKRFERIPTEDLEKFYRGTRVGIPTTNGKMVERSEAQIWLDSPARKQFIGGVTFAPGATVPPDMLNLWRGFSVDPRSGDWGLLKEHIRAVACRGDEGLFAYVMSWMAQLVQRPGELPGVAIILQGKKGCGKGTIAHALLKIFGQHGLAISNPQQLAGRFTGHLRDVVFLFTDEACFADDRETIGRLNALITEPEVTLEAKGRDTISVPNFLHHMMASNERVVVPMTSDERRYLTLTCDESFSRGGARSVEARSYFNALYRQLDEGGYAAMLRELLDRDISRFEVRDVPDAPGNREHVAASGSLAHRWLYEVLDRGYVLVSQHGYEMTFQRWESDVASELLFASYEAYARENRKRPDLTREQLGKFLEAIGFTQKARPRGDVLCGEGRTTPLRKSRAWQRRLGTLTEARGVFVKRMGIALPETWADDAQAEAEDARTGAGPARCGPVPGSADPTGRDPY